MNSDQAKYPNCLFLLFRAEHTWPLPEPTFASTCASNGLT